MKAIVALSLAALLTGCATTHQTNMPPEYRKLYSAHVADPEARKLVCRAVSAHYALLSQEWGEGTAAEYQKAKADLASAKASVASYLRVDPATLTDLNENLKP